MERQEHHQTRNDLTEAMLRAQTEGWEPDRLDRVRNLGWTTWDHDSGAGEGWAGAFDGNNLAAWVWMAGPFAITLRGSKFAPPLRNEGVTVIEVPDWDEECLSLATDRLNDLFGAKGWRDSVDSSACSARDLWWATI